MTSPRRDEGAACADTLGADRLAGQWPCDPCRHEAKHERAVAAMAGFIIQRLIQAVVVMLVMSMLVFAGVYAIGNPIDVLISPDSTQDASRTRG